MIIHFSWLNSHCFYLLPLVVLIAGVLCYQWFLQYKVIQRLSSKKHQPAMLLHFSPLKRIFKILIFFTGILFLFIALMRPAYKKESLVLGQSGRDLFIALDISRSMLVKDRKPDRLHFAKNKIEVLLKKLKAERVGLIVFSGSTFIQCPLTTDFDAFLMYLNQLDVETISSGTTAIDQAISCALEAFANSKKEKHKLLALFTDGEDFSSNLQALKQQAKEDLLHIFTIGIGSSEGGPIPIYDQNGNLSGHQKDAAGAIVVSRLNAGLLKNLSVDSGGTFILASESNDKDIETIVHAVSKFEKEKMDDKVIDQSVEYYHYPLLISFICFVLEWLL